MVYGLQILLEMTTLFYRCIRGWEGDYCESRYRTPYLSCECGHMCHHFIISVRYTISMWHIYVCLYEYLPFWYCILMGYSGQHAACFVTRQKATEKTVYVVILRSTCVLAEEWFTCIIYDNSTMRQMNIWERLFCNAHDITCMYVSAGSLNSLVSVWGE